MCFDGVDVLCIVASFVREYVRRVLLLNSDGVAKRRGKGELEEDKKERTMATAKSSWSHSMAEYRVWRMVELIRGWVAQFYGRRRVSDVF